MGVMRISELTLRMAVVEPQREKDSTPTPAIML
jgi:hypothetical protein